ncbi:MAG: alpha/beta fold hydrolase [Ilumatobacteraceae bacterium]|nr:alpha/beta fold hydrolase [Ilumatobacteraceae bacterium]
MTIFMSRDGVGDSLCFLHGFTQTHTSWDYHRDFFRQSNTTLAPDLPGHGRSPDGAMSMTQMADELAIAIKEPTVLVGYSFGARLALHTALQHPDQVRALVLVSATAGIEDLHSRQERVLADEALAARALQIGVEAFIDEWLSRDLFASLTPSNNQRSLRCENTALGLAQSLRFAGTGAQESLWDQLDQITSPTLVVAGQHDAKFVAIAQRLHQRISQSELHILEAGHSVHIEQPKAFLTLLKTFLDRLER